ncbi:sigma-70 family RNA polymerase sigma factor [Saccharothrix syringae]|uniref:Sigma-70 family RNA polymerase sigma factor n=2 Tax=Saccharothrix syringae TaxID=103733 RepID=A0A5Q0HDX6_SACSY|nr:sigma-70 family RNA polymerase sigma factor [Saccharothrix syringae]
MVAPHGFQVYDERVVTLTVLTGNATIADPHDVRDVDRRDTSIDALVDGAAHGDQAAIHALMTRIRPHVVRYCRLRGLDRTPIGTDDVTQEVCLAVPKALPTFREQGRTFLAFVYGITSHKVTDARRAMARNGAEPVPELPDHPSTERGPEEQALAEDAHTRLMSLPHHLPDRQRKILVLRVGAGLSAEETAHLLDSTPNAVRVAQHRALKRLRGLFRDG